MASSLNKLLAAEPIAADDLDRTMLAHAYQRMLSDELHHRVQNTLAVVLALARLTARSVTTIEAFQKAFGERVQAMARTNALLLRDHLQAVDVRTALKVELEPYCGDADQVTLECEALSIAAGAALSLSLLIHELATNAVKYGALSSPAGRLSIRCERGDVGGVLKWRETSPELKRQVHGPGGGSRLIQHLARDLGGAASIDIKETGLEATITFRLDDGGGAC